MGLQLPIETAISMMGIEDDIQRLSRSEKSHHTVVHTDTDGVTRSVHLCISKNNDATYKISADYLIHAGTNYYSQHNIFSFQTDKNLFPIDVNIMGDHYSEVPTRKIYKIIKDLRRRIGDKKEWANFIKIIEDAEIKPKWRSHANWPGLSQNGEIQAVRPHKIDSISVPVFPALFLPGLLGCGPEYYSNKKEIVHSFHVQDANTQDDIVLNYRFLRGNNPLNIYIRCYLTRVGDDEWSEQPLYELQSTSVHNNTELGIISSLKIHHVNAPEQMDCVDVKDPQAVATALKSIRMLNRLVRGGDKEFKDDVEKPVLNRRLYMPSDIWSLTSLNDVLTPQTPASSRGRFCFTPMGGQNTKKVFSDFDYHIGGNSYRFDYYSPSQAQAKSIIVDMGILFHDNFDASFTNLARYFPHKTNKNHQPTHNVKAICFTHRHKDHISQLVYLIKHGYEIPPIIMPPMAVRQIKREMAELDIQKPIRKEIESKFIILDRNHLPKGMTENSPHIFTIKNEKIKTYWEELDGKQLGQKEQYPVVEIDDFKLRIGPMPHSDPGFMYEVITPAGSHLHTGDFKMDPTIQIKQPSFKTWLQSVQARSLSIDSTGATRDEDERTPWESEIKQSVVKIFKQNPSNRFICPILGSNASRFTTLIAAMAEAGKKYLVIDGRALEDLYSDLNEIYDIKKWAKQTYGVVIARKGTKEAFRIYEEEKDCNYVIAVTGTQMEAPSSLNRSLSGWLPSDRYQLNENDIIVPLQGPIPVGDNDYKRRAAQYFAEVFYGLKFMLPEIVEQESDLKISGSGHASPIDIKELYSYLPNLQTVFPVHGGPKQLHAGAKIARGSNYQPIVAHNFENYEITKNGNVTRHKIETAEMVGVKTHLPNEHAFWLRRHFSTTVAPIPIHDNSKTGVLLSQFENAVLQSMEMPTRNLLTEKSRFHLSRTFNMSALGGFLTGNYKFGIERYKTSAFADKAIGVVAAFDTETTGTDERFDFITQFSMKAWDVNRKALFETELKQKTPDYHVPNPEALIVTLTPPDEKPDNELHPLLFAESVKKAIRTAKSKAKTLAEKRLPQIFKDNPNTRAKMLFIAHNFPFDDRQLKTLFKDTLDDRFRPHVSDGVIGIDTIHLARAVHAIYPDHLKMRKHEGSDFYNFTLQALCEENGIAYDLRRAHNSALYDSERAVKLFWKLQDIAPDIVEQMIFNADSSKKQLLNDMIGHYTGIGGAHPVFSYLSKRRDRTDIRMGCFVGVIDGGSKAVIANISYNPQDVLSLSPEKMADALADKNDDRLEVIDLRQNPMVFSAKYFYERNNARNFPREMFDRRARMVDEYLNYRDADLGMSNLPERLSMAWENKKIPILKKYKIIDRNEPDLNAPQIDLLANARNNITALRNDSARANATKSFNPAAQSNAKEIKKYRQAVVEYLEVEPKRRTKKSLKELNLRVQKILKNPRLSKGQAFLVANIHFDLNASALPPQHRQDIESHRAFHTQHTLYRAHAVIQKLETNKEHYQKLIGRSLKKKRILNQLKQKIDAAWAWQNYDDIAAKRAVMPHNPKYDAA